MDLTFVSTIGGNLFYLGDTGDENAPMVEIRFQNEFQYLGLKDKRRIAAAMMSVFIREVNADPEQGAERIQAEIAALDQLLRTLPDNDVLGKVSLKARRQELKDEALSQKAKVISQRFADHLFSSSGEKIELTEPEIKDLSVIVREELKRP